MSNPSEQTLYKMVSDAGEFFKKYFEKHENFDPENTTHRKMLQKALEDEGFDRSWIGTLSLSGSADFFPAEMVRTRIRKYLKENPGFDPAKDSDLGQLTKGLFKEEYSRQCRLGAYMQVLMEETKV